MMDGFFIVIGALGYVGSLAAFAFFARAERWLFASPALCGMIFFALVLGGVVGGSHG